MAQWGASLKFSIITAVYNSKDTLGKCLDSVLMQRDIDVESIVVDGGSTDGTLEVIRERQSKISRWSSEPDSGIYDALNKGIQKATGDVIGILHADDFYPTPDVLRKVDAFWKSPAEAILTDILFVDRSQPEKPLRFVSAKKWRPSQIKRGWIPPHPGIFVKKNVFARLGEYRTDLRIAGDFEWVARAFYRHPTTYAYLNQTSVHMRIGGLSTRGFGRHFRIHREIKKALRLNGIPFFEPFLWLRFPMKLLQFFLRPRP